MAVDPRGYVRRGADGRYDPALVARTYDELGWVTLPGLFSAAQLAPMATRLALNVEQRIADEIPTAPPPGPDAALDTRLVEALDTLEPGASPPPTGFTPFHVQAGDDDAQSDTGASAVFALVHHVELLEALGALLGPSITYSYAGICRTRLPDHTAPPSRASLPFPLHQDSQYYDTSHFKDGIVRPGLEQSTANCNINANLF